MMFEVQSHVHGTNIVLKVGNDFTLDIDTIMNMHTPPDKCCIHRVQIQVHALVGA